MNIRTYPLILLFISLSLSNIYGEKSLEKKIGTPGYFQIGKIGKQYIFITPTGKPFFSIGICHLTQEGFYSPELKYSPYKENLKKIYNNNFHLWKETTLNRLKNWGFNTLGAFSDIALFSEDMPYTLVLNLSSQDWVKGTFPDVFDPAFESSVRIKCQEMCLPRAKDKNLIGYFTDNELRWGPDWRSKNTLFDDYLSFPSYSYGKKRLVEYLQKKYKNDVKEFNKIYNLNLKNFDELLTLQNLSTNTKYYKEIISDKNGFLKIIAEKYFSIVWKTIKWYDPNHLILGCRFHSGGAPKEVLEAISKYTDVVSVNYYPLGETLESLVTSYLQNVSMESTLIKYHQITKKPILITEFSFKAMDSGLPNTMGAGLALSTQKDRAKYSKIYIEKFFNTNYIIGYHWYCYMDEPKEGRFDGENSNFGLVNEKDEVYRELTETLGEVNKKIEGLLK